MDERNNYEEYEIDLREYILLIWDKKFLLVGLVVFAMIAAVIFTNLVADPQYEASSTLLIMPPMYTTSIEVGSFPIETYRELSKTAQMRTKIIEKLDLRDDEGELISQSSLEEKMEFEITGREEVEREEEMVEVPLVRLNVIHKDAEVAAEIANLWAELFMEDTREIRRAETTEISNLIERRFEDTRERLTSAREELKNFLTETGLEELKMRLSSEKNQLEQVIKNKTGLEHDVTILEAELNEIEDQIDELNIDGIWAGELSAELVSEEEVPRSISRYFEAQNKLLEHKQVYDFSLLEKLLELEEKAALLAEEIDEYQNNLHELDDGSNWIGELGLTDNWTEIPEAIERYSQSRERLLNHRQEYNFDLMEQEIDRYEERVLFYKTEIENINRNLEVNNKLIDSVEGLLTEEPDRWELNRSLSEDVIWQELFNPEELEIISNVVLNEEIVNPLYRELRNIKQRTQIEQDTFKAELTELESDYNSARNALEELKNVFEEQSDVRARLIEDKDNYYKIYNSLVDQYIGFRENISNKELELQLNRAEVRALKLDLESLLVEIDYDNYNIEELRDLIATERLKRSRLEDDKDHYGKIYNQEASFYKTLEDDYRKLNAELRQKRAQYETVKNEEERLSERVAELDNQIREYEIVEEDLNQQIDDYQESYQQLASRVEEARLAQAEQTSDVKFIADAVQPERATIGVGNTMLNMAVAAVLAGMLGIFGIFFAEFIKENEE